MNSFKSHITLILALVSILTSIFLYRLFRTVLNEYQHTILNNYSIVIVSTKKIEHIDYPLISSISQIDISSKIKKLKKKFENINLEDISLPFFYKLKLKTLPSPAELKNLEEFLKSFPYIKRVLTYSSSQTKIYNLLTLLKLISNIFMLAISALGFLLIVKQLEVWKLQHSQRMYIMELFGAPFWFKGAVLFKIAFLNSLIAIILSTISIIFIKNSSLFNMIINDLKINLHINYFKEILLLLTISLTISLISSILVIIGKK